MIAQYVVKPEGWGIWKLVVTTRSPHEIDHDHGHEPEHDHQAPTVVHRSRHPSQQRAIRKGRKVLYRLGLEERAKRGSMRVEVDLAHYPTSDLVQ